MKTKQKQWRFAHWHSGKPWGFPLWKLRGGPKEVSWTLQDQLKKINRRACQGWQLYLYTKEGVRYWVFTHSFHSTVNEPFICYMASTVGDVMVGVPQLYPEDSDVALGPQHDQCVFWIEKPQYHCWRQHMKVTPLVMHFQKPGKNPVDFCVVESMNF